MTYKQAKMVQSFIFELDSLIDESCFVCAIQHASYDDAVWYCYLCVRSKGLSDFNRIFALGDAIARISDDWVAVIDEYDIGTTSKQIVPALRLF